MLTAGGKLGSSLGPWGMGKQPGKTELFRLIGIFPFFFHREEVTVSINEAISPELKKNSVLYFIQASFSLLSRAFNKLGEIVKVFTSYELSRK